MANKKLPLIYRIKRAIKQILGYPVRLGNDLKVRPTDRFIVSYPKSGNTWMRFLVGNLLSNEPINFLNVEYVVPDMYAMYTGKFMRALPSTRYIKSHEPFDPRYNKVVYIVRDGRDVAVSYYFHLKKWKNIDLGFSAYLEKFLQGQLNNYGNWGDHIHSWMQQLGHQPDRFLLIRYEDLKKDTHKELSKVSKFLRLEKSIEQIDLAIKNSSFEKMAQLEKEAEGQYELFRNANKEIKFVRSGKVGGWKDVFTISDKDVFNYYFGSTLIFLGYETSESW